MTLAMTSLVCGGVRNTKIVGSKFAIVEPFNRESKQTIMLLPTSDPKITSGRRRALQVLSAGRFDVGQERAASQHPGDGLKPSLEIAPPGATSIPLRLPPRSQT